MALIKCDNCGKDVSSNASSCVHCGKEMNTISSNNYNNGNATERNIAFFLKISKVLKYVCYILAGIILFIGFGNAVDSENIGAFVSPLFISVILVILGVLSTPFLEWKAYMLQHLYEINNKKLK